jgi:hypothetical protein
VQVCSGSDSAAPIARSLRPAFLRQPSGSRSLRDRTTHWAPGHGALRAADEGSAAEILVVTGGSGGMSRRHPARYGGAGRRASRDAGSGGRALPPSRNRARHEGRAALRCALVAYQTRAFCIGTGAAVEKIYGQNSAVIALSAATAITARGLTRRDDSMRRDRIKSL